MVSRIKLKYIVIVVCSIIIIRYFGILSHLFERDYYTDFNYPYDGDVQKFVEQILNNEKPDVAPINEYNYAYLMDCRNKCGTGSELRLVYIVKSAADHFDRRKAIRQSWGFEHRFSDVPIRTVFVVGTVHNASTMDMLRTEGRQHGDVLQADFIDTYFNNTIKTMMSFRWAVRFCPQAKFYMFVDDDMYVSTKNVLRFVRNPLEYPAYLEDEEHNWIVPDVQLSDDVRLWAGHVFASSAPHRHRSSKWYVTLAEYPWHLWPPYVSAGAYVLSRTALHHLNLASRYTRHFRFDDIYLGLVALKVDIEPFHSSHFHFYKQPYSLLAYQYTVASHGFHRPAELLDVWNQQRQAGNA